jgi:spoIIIJ-associated protein
MGAGTRVDEQKYTAANVGDRIGNCLRPMLANAGLDLRFDVVDGENPHPEIENPEVVVKFSGPDVDLLLANKAELLLALEYLTMEMLHVPQEHHERLCFDANDYRMLRIAELRLSATTAAEKVRRTRVPFHFSPMTSRERRIIHLALRNDASVRSESAGIGPYRQVVIYPADMPTPPDADRVANATRLPPSRPMSSGGPPEHGRGGGGDRDRRGGSRGFQRGGGGAGGGGRPPRRPR